MVDQELKNAIPHLTSAAYVVVAMTNASRAAAFRTAALDLTSDVVLASDGTAAKQLISRRGAPRLLITDLSLPATDGFALVRHLRQAAPKSQSAVIVLSAHEALRSAARDLSESLGIAKVLRPDTDRPALRAALAAAWEEVVDAPSSLSLRRDEAEKKPSSPTGTAFEEVLHETVLAATRRFHIAGAGVYVKVNGESRFAAHASAVNPVDLFTGPTGWSALQQVATSGEPLIVPDVNGHPVFGETAGGAPAAARGFATVPVSSGQGTSWGALCVIATEPLALDASAVEALSALAGDLGRVLDERVGALQQAARFQVLEQLAATDPLTGLANRRGGEKSIASEISRSKREQKALSCILIDIDRFKQVNDTYGHPAGDQLLRELSTILRRSVRAYDIVIRWGGEEFLLVLPGADLVAARSLAERVRTAVEALVTHAVGGVTISAGVAAFGEDYDLDAAIRVADRRLYQAKAAGRNCVI